MNMECMHGSIGYRITTISLSFSFPLSLPRCLSCEHSSKQMSMASRSAASVRAGVQQLLRTGIGMRQQALAAAPSWPRDEVMTLPNALSLSRIALGPAVAWAVSAGDFGAAAAGVACAGASDYLDGAIARVYCQRSVLGSHLDPLADKIFLIVSTTALSAAGALPVPASAALVLSHGTLVAGGFLKRAQELRWRWTGASEFFRVRSSCSNEHADHMSNRSSGFDGTVSPAARAVTPLGIGKLLTVLHYSLLGYVCAWQALPAPENTVDDECGESDVQQQLTSGRIATRAVADGGIGNSWTNVLAICTGALVPVYVGRTRSAILAFRGST